MNYNVKNILFNKISDPILISLSTILFLLKIKIDLISYLFFNYSSFLPTSVRFLTSILIVIPLVIYYFRNFYIKLNNPNEISFKSFNNEIKTINFLLLIIIFATILVPDSLSNFSKINNLITLIYINFFDVLCLIVGFKFIHFIFKWLWLKRHKKTKFQLKIFKYSLIIHFFLEIPIIFNHLGIIENNFQETIFILINIIQIFLIIFIVFSANKKNWIALLNKKQKYLTILQSSFNIILSIILLSIIYQNDTSSKIIGALVLFYPSFSFINWPLFIGIGFFFRVLLSAVVSLPTTEIVGKKSNELNLLTYLNKIISQSIDFDNLLNSATSVAYESIKATGAWSEIYSENDEIEIKFTENINQDILFKLYNNSEFSKIFKNIHNILLIESIEDYSRINSSFKLVNFAQALIAVPFYEGNKRIGTLIVTSVDEYGFDLEDLEIIQAIGNNINIALENAKLLKESIEKERIKKELYLARLITQKLIPQNICCIDNYDISSFFMPAEEVGGDYYDIVTLKDGKKCILIGDISGKGISAAFYMALLKGIVLCSARQSSNPSELLSNINKALFNNMDRQMYLTLSALKIEDNYGNLSFARAGHLPLLIKQNNQIHTIIPKGIGIGLVNYDLFDKNLEMTNFILNNNDYIILFTDGISDFIDSEKDNTNYKNLKQILLNSVYYSTGELVKIFEDNIMNNSSLIQRDDMTLLILRYNILGDKNE